LELQISPSGRRHLAWAQRDWVNLESMAEVTPLLDLEAHTAIKAAFQSNTAHGRREAVRVFINYLLGEDAHYCVIPKHVYYSSQDNFCRTLVQQARLLVSTAGGLNAARRSRSLCFLMPRFHASDLAPHTSSRWAVLASV